MNGVGRRPGTHPLQTSRQSSRLLLRHSTRARQLAGRSGLVTGGLPTPSRVVRSQESAEPASWRPEPCSNGGRGNESNRLTLTDLQGGGEEHERCSPVALAGIPYRGRIARGVHGRGVRGGRDLPASGLPRRPRLQVPAPSAHPYRHPHGADGHRPDLLPVGSAIRGAPEPRHHAHVPGPRKSSALGRGILRAGPVCGWIPRSPPCGGRPRDACRP